MAGEQDRDRKQDGVEREVARGDAGVGRREWADREEAWLEDGIRMPQLPPDQHRGENEQEWDSRGEYHRGVAPLDHAEGRPDQDGRQQRSSEPIERGRGDDAGTPRHSAPGDRERGCDERDVDEEDGTPPSSRHEHAADERPETGGQRDRASHDPECASAAIRRDELADETGAVREDDRARDGLQHAEHDQERERRSRRGAERRDPEDRKPSEHERSAAVPVAELACDGLNDGEGEKVRGDEPSHGADRGVEVVDDVRYRDGDHRRVERRQQGAQRHGDQHRSLGTRTSIGHSAGVFHTGCRVVNTAGART